LHRRPVLRGPEVDKKNSSVPQIAARFVSKRRSPLFKHFIFCGIFVPVRYTRPGTTSGGPLARESDDNTLAIGKTAVRIMGVRAAMAIIGRRTNRLSGQPFQLAFSEAGTLC
jgi:hypothetical protein